MMQTLGAMEQTVGWDVKDVPGCNDLGPLLASIKRTSASIESDLDSGYQDVCLDNRSATPAASKHSQESDVDSIDKDSNSDTESVRQLEKGARIYNELVDEKVKEIFSVFKVDLPENWSELGKTEKVEVINDYFRKYCPNVPESLIANVSGAVMPGDSGNLPSDVPDWLDKEKFARGQRFAQDNLFGILFSEGLSLYGLYSFQDGLQPLILTGRSVDPYTAFKRFLSTASRIRNWFTSDPWTKGTPAYRDMQMVRNLHASVRKQLRDLSKAALDELTKIKKPLAVKTDLLREDFRASCPAARTGQCPHMMEEFRSEKPRGLSQGEMGLTMFGFVSLPILFPEAFGIHNATEEDLDDFCHLWRGLGYLLGISDEFNFCRGDLIEIKQRSRDFLDYWVKPNFREIPPEFEHMMRCVYEGVNFYVPGLSYDASLLYLTDLMGLHMPKLRASMSYYNWFRYHLTKHLFYYSFKFNWIKSFLNGRINAMINKALAYDDKKHVELKKKSEKIVSTVLERSHNEMSGDLESTNL